MQADRKTEDETQMKKTERMNIPQRRKRSKGDSIAYKAAGVIVNRGYHKPRRRWLTKEERAEMERKRDDQTRQTGP